MSLGLGVLKMVLFSLNWALKQRTHKHTFSHSVSLKPRVKVKRIEANFSFPPSFRDL